MNTRESLLDHLIASPRFDGQTAGQVLAGLSPAMSALLTQEDRHFFSRHADDPGHEVARACKAGHAWHGDERVKK